MVPVLFIHRTLVQHGTVVTAEFVSDTTTQNARPRWPRGLRRVSGAARSQGFGVRIPPGAWMSVVLHVVR